MEFFGFHGLEKKLNDMIHDSFRSQKHPMLTTQLNGKLGMQSYTNIKIKKSHFLLLMRMKTHFLNFKK